MREGKRDSPAVLALPFVYPQPDDESRRRLGGGRPCCGRERHLLTAVPAAGGCIRDLARLRHGPAGTRPRGRQRLRKEGSRLRQGPEHPAKTCSAGRGRRCSARHCHAAAVNAAATHGIVGPVLCKRTHCAFTRSFTRRPLCAGTAPDTGGAAPHEGAGGGATGRKHTSPAVISDGDKCCQEKETGNGARAVPPVKTTNELGRCCYGRSPGSG